MLRNAKVPETLIGETTGIYKNPIVDVVNQSLASVTSEKSSNSSFNGFSGDTASPGSYPRTDANPLIVTPNYSTPLLSTPTSRPGTRREIRKAISELKQNGRGCSEIKKKKKAKKQFKWERY